MRESLHIALVTACVCGAVISAGMWTGSEGLAAIFLNSGETAYQLAVKGLPLLGLCALPFAINITFIGFYQSCERASQSIVYMLLRGVIFMVPGFLLLPTVIGDDGLWLAIPFSEILTGIIIVAAYLYSRNGVQTRLTE